MRESAVPFLVEVPERENLNDLLARRVAIAPSAVLFERKTGDGAWASVSARAFANLVAAVAKGLISHGLEIGDRVGIMSHTRFEWSVLDWACWAAGLIPVPIYETSSDQQLTWIVRDSGIRLLVVETATHAAMAANARQQAPTLSTVLVIEDDALELLSRNGQDVADQELIRRREDATQSSVATIIYTSGTTGRPKGVELTHGNFHSLAVNAVAAVPEVFGSMGARTLLFMPLAHVFARFIEVLVIAGGTTMAHTPDTATLMEDLAAFRPTYILSVPRVFEKVYNGAEQHAAAEGHLKIFRWAAATAIEYSQALDTPKGPGRALRARRALADRLVFSKLKARMGGAIGYAVSGGAPLGARLGHFFRGIGITILEGYGLTESAAPTCVNRPAAQRIGSVGQQLPGCSVRIDDDGEILLRGHHIFVRYHENPEATRAALTDGWLHTGDLGSLDDDGYLFITGRKKEIIVTAGGKNVAPAVLEDQVRAHPLVSQCVVVGDRRPFIGALVTLDAEGLPGWLAMHHLQEMSVEQAAKDPDVLAAIDKAVQQANQAVSRAESIRKVTILTTDFSIANGYLTPSLKVKRDAVSQDFAADIEAIYADGPAPVH